MKLLTYAATLLLTSVWTLGHAQSFLDPDPQSTDGPPAYVGPATTQSGVENTGTDVVQLDPDSRLQAMVWDYLNPATGQTNITLSWSIFQPGKPKGYKQNALNVVCPPSTGKVSDPDVVMSRNQQGDLFANVVYIADIVGQGGQHASHTYRNFYKWDPGTASFAPYYAAGNFYQALGHDNLLPNVLGFQPPYVVRNHSRPHIDANANGYTAIAWEEASVETARVTVVSASHPNGYSYDIESVTFAESFFLTTTIDNPASCNNEGYLVTRRNSGNYPQVNPPILGNQTLRPDVAVGKDNTVWLTFILSSATQGDPPIQAGLNLVIRKVQFDLCSLASVDPNYEKVYGISGIVPPRITALPETFDTPGAEVVIAQSGGGCVGPTTYSIMNYGYFGDGWHEPRVVNPEVPYLPASEPVVAYYGGEKNKVDGRYIVSWTGTGYERGDRDDIWARSLKAGDFISPIDYSRVNSLVDGDQRHPSVAARYVGDDQSSAHLFANPAAAQVGNKVVSTPAGYPLLRPVGPAPTPAAPASEPGVQVSPNPFTQEVSFQLNLRPREEVSLLQVVDLAGRVVATLDAREATSGTMVWHPKQPLSSGAYLVRMVTNQRTQKLKLLKN